MKPEKWWFPKPVTLLTNEEKKLIMGCVTEQLVKLVFTTYYYVWDGDIYHQEEGCPMGVQSSCPVSRVVMDYWADVVHELEERMEALVQINPVQYENFKLYLLQKYVDDVMTALEEMKRGTRWDSRNKVMIWTPEAAEQDAGKDPEQVTMEAVTNMASSILACLQFTWDSPAQNKTGMMPLLDTMIWVGQSARSWGVPEEMLPEETSLPTKTGALNRIILYKFFRKPVASNTPMHSRSAVPTKDQVQTVTNEF